MGLDFSTLVQAALGGSAAYSTGKRSGRQDRDEREAKKLKREQDALDREEEAKVRASTIRSNDALTRQRQWEIDNPKPANLDADERFAAKVEDLMKQGGHTLETAHVMARQMLGRDPVRPEGMKPGSPEDLNYKRQIAVINASTAAQYRAPPRGRSGDDDGEDGSVKSGRSRVAYIRKRVPELVKGEWNTTEGKHVGGLDATAAARRADQEWYAASFSDATSSGSTTSKAMARGISANAGRSGVKPTESTSTPKANPLNANSPKAGTRPRPDPEDLKMAKADPQYAAYLKSQGYSW